MLASGGTVAVQAHTTIGNLTGSQPLFRTNDHQSNPTNTFGQAHVPGPVGYVWPGSGLNMYTDVHTHPPGYQSPFITFEQPLQAGANSYAPEGAILTSTSDHESIGDLIFAINFSQPRRFITESNPNPDFNYSTIAIYIPAPVFDKTGALIQDGFEPAGGIDWGAGENTNIVTTITDNYGNIFATRADEDDPFQPGSWIVFIAPTTGINFVAARNWSEWYYVRINQMKAPFVAGRYFFKMFLDDHYPVRSSTPSDYVNSTMPMENWPILLVKGEVDPGMISGTVRHGDVATRALYGQSINLPGKVRAVGFATDPLTGELTGRAVEARGYFNGSAQGHYEIEGVAPGVYDIFASAAGFPEQKVAENVRIFRGQSLVFDAYLKAGLELRGEVFSKDKFGLTNWSGTRPVSVVIYDSDTYGSDSIVTYSPINLTQAPYASYVHGNVRYASTTGYTRLTGEPGVVAGNDAPKKVSFPWEGPLALPAISWAEATASNDPDGTVKDDFGLFNGVGPAQYWWVDQNGYYTNSESNSFRFQFGIRGFYGVPTEMSGMVPQVFATWTDSLTPGRYYIRVFVNGYVQTANDGARFMDYDFIVPNEELSRDISVPIDLWRSSTINVTVHFHDLPSTIEDVPMRGPDPRRFLLAEAFASDGTLAAFNFTQIPVKDRYENLVSEWNITLNGLGMAGPMTVDAALPDSMSRMNVKYSLARYRGLYDYGLPTDTYTIRVFMRGYIQAIPPATSFEELDQPLTVTVSIGTGVADVSTHMYRGGGINVTVFSTDWQRPHVDKEWIWNDASVSALVYDVASANFIDAIYFWNAKIEQWSLPKQDSDFNSIPWPTWKTDFGSGASYLLTNGSTLVDRFGPDVPNPLSDDQTQDMASALFYQENFHIGFLYGSFSYRDSSYRSTLAVYPGVYAVNVGTYGYVQENLARFGTDLGNVQVPVGWIGSIADTSVKLMIGVNFSITMLFKTEGIFSKTPYNTSIRISVFDEGDTLVAAATVSSNAGSLTSNAGLFADGKQVLQDAIPDGTWKLECAGLAGLIGYVEPSIGSAGVQAATLFSPNYGVWGRSTYAGSYTGQWLVMVDFVNRYLPDRFYPPVPALLQGEYAFFLPYNHLGPYRQQAYTSIPNVVLGGEASIVFELDLRSYVQGTVHGLDWNDATRTISWVSIEFKTDQTTYHWYSWDGWFDGYLDPGEYLTTVTEWTNRNEGHEFYEFRIDAGTGQINRAFTITLGLTGIPIPEFSVSPMIAASLAAAMIWIKCKCNPSCRPEF